MGKFVEMWLASFLQQRILPYKFKLVGTLILLTMASVPTVIGILWIIFFRGRWGWYKVSFFSILFLNLAFITSSEYNFHISTLPSILFVVCLYFLTRKVIEIRDNIINASDSEIPEFSQNQDKRFIIDFIVSIIGGVITAAICKLLGL